MKQSSRVKMELLLLEDVTNLGRKGELASAKPGFVRNFLLPHKKAVIADKRTIRMQERLRKEREVQAAVDKKDAEALAVRLKGKTLSITVKNDTQGHLYGSVAAADIVKILEQQEGVKLERKNVILPKPIKSLGVFDIQLKLKEEIPATFKLKVDGETKVREPESNVEVVEEGAQENLEAFSSEEGVEEIPTHGMRVKEMKEELEERSKES
jgi:large subunit ribosomal protein L9